MTDATKPTAAKSGARPDRGGARVRQCVARPRGAGQTPDDADALTALQSLPSIGPRLAEKLLLLNARSPADLRGRDPETLYDELRAQLGPVDRCVLYAFRCAVYAAEHAVAHGGDPGGERGLADPGGEYGAADPGGDRVTERRDDRGADDPELAKWWNWKDGGPALQRTQGSVK